MRIGKWILFGSAPAPAPVLGLEEAEKIFKSANGHIKGDESKAVPFAIIATAQVLGADVRIEEECEVAQMQLRDTYSKVDTELVDFTKATHEEIAELERKIERRKLILTEGTMEMNRRKEDLRSRHNEVLAVQAFFNTATTVS